MRSVAIIGMSPSQIDAPWNDPAWERWLLAWDRMAIDGRPTRCFEIHSPEQWAKYHNGQPRHTPYRDTLREIRAPILMQQAHDDIPTSEPYPIREVVARLGGRDYFGSSIAYMLALALYEQVDRVGIWGVELSHSDYHHQRPNIEYMIGRLEEAGIHVESNNPRGSILRLLPPPASDTGAIWWRRYGWIPEPHQSRQWTPEELAVREQLAREAAEAK